MNLLKELRLIIPTLASSLDDNKHLSNYEFFDLLPKQVPQTDEEYLDLFYQMYSFYDMKKSENMTPDFMLAMINFYPRICHRTEIISGMEKLFLLFETFDDNKTI